MKGKYLIYRIYTKKERPNINDRSILYGWSSNKFTVKGFMQQRANDKYRVFKMNQEELDRAFHEEIDDPGEMIDFIKLKSVKSGEYLYLFMTRNEMCEVEKRIQRLFADQSCLDTVKGNGNYLEMFLNLDDYYADALYFIGYRPREVDIMFPSANPNDDYSNINAIEDEIDYAYDGFYESPQEVYGKQNKALGISFIEDVSNKILYSVESFIKVMKEDM